MQQLHKQQQQSQQYQYAMQNTAGPSFDAGRYSEVYYPPGSKIACQQQLQQQYHNHYHHHQNNMQQPYQYYQQYYGQLQHQNQSNINTRRDNYDNKQQQQQQQQRPKSVYVTTPHRNDIDEVSVSKNYNSSGDVTSTSFITNDIHKERRIRRENSGEPANEKTSIPISNGRNNKYSQQPDQMSTSLPNVLAEDLKILCQEFRNEQNVANSTNNGNIAGGFFSNPPPKSMSGDTFLNDNNADLSLNVNYNKKNHDAVADFIYDNMSEGSYRLADYSTASQLDGGGNSSSQSDVGTSGIDSARILSTIFTTKRVGNVIVKRVIGIIF